MVFMERVISIILNSNVLSMSILDLLGYWQLLRQLSLLFIAQLTKYAAIQAYGASRNQMDCHWRLIITLPTGPKAVCFHLPVTVARNQSLFSKPSF